MHRPLRITPETWNVLGKKQKALLLIANNHHGDWVSTTGPMEVREGLTLSKKGLSQGFAKLIEMNLIELNSETNYFRLKKGVMA